MLNSVMLIPNPNTLNLDVIPLDVIPGTPFRRYSFRRYSRPYENNKNPKILIFQNFTNFCQIFNRRRRLECFKGSSREKLVVQ